MRQWRLNLILFLFALFAAAIISRLFYLQIQRGDFHKALAQGQQAFFEAPTVPRGTILIQNKEGELAPLAVNTIAKYVYASPVEIDDKVKTAQELSAALNIPEAEILTRISDQDSLYAPLKRRLTPEEVAAVEELGLSGIYVRDYEIRYFPRNNFAAHILGFVGAEGKGQYGVEGYYDVTLKGGDGFLKEGRALTAQLEGGSLMGRPAWIFSDAFMGEKALKGADLTLTIDPDIQFFTEELLKSSQENLKFKEGTVIVMDPKTGRIIALANYPAFDPNRYQLEKDLEIFQNSAAQKLYEPGSSFKPFTMAAALNEKKITPDTKYVDEGIVRIGGYAIYNYGNRVWGERSMTEVLERSINTGAVFAERQLGHVRFLEYIKKFGFLDPTGVDLQGEVFSSNASLQNGREINFATASFGQGIEVTPLQMIRAFAALVNGGNLVRPYVVDKIVKSDGTVLQTEPELKSGIISQETSSKIVAMLLSVVENGFGKAARIPGYYIGGKTGTAQVAWSASGVNKPGYSDETVQSFVGFAPAFDPKFIILVKLNNPQTKTAEYSAVPVFHDLAKYILDYWGVPTDYE